MTSKARASLAKAMELFGDDGRLRVFKDPDDPLVVGAEGSDLAPHSPVTAPVDGDALLRHRVREANARSRGELL